MRPMESMHHVPWVQEAAEKAVRQEITTLNHRASYFKVHKEASVFQP